ncbi:hypothetical protein CAEBREN_20229 [Caenorhabditis brenneri]|uniref:BTB domain-containing protein n=1 Tax=Caenorhabditis brenneri TaxID=135651 RepID=G0M9W9_CAEBE|nr:hypothetical protein CAEBREN_20229 [Caenorhabditis brenneri]
MNVSNSLEAFVYPIKRTIHFKIEDIKGFGEKGRFSTPVKIGKTKWYIEAQITTSNHITKERCFLLYLKNLHRFLPGEKIVLEYQFKMLNQNPSKNKVCHEIELRTFQIHQSLGGNGTPIEKLELMNGGFVKNGNIIIECDVQIYLERLEESGIILQELRPNNQDVEQMFSDVDYKPIKKVIEMEIQLSKLTICVPYSQSIYIDEIPFKIEVRKECENWMSIWLFCNQEDRSDWWKVNVLATFQLINRSSNVKSNSLLIRPTLLERSNIKCGKNRWIKWDELMDPDHVCVKKGRIVVEVIVDILGKYGFDETTGQGIEKPMKRMTDALILVDETEFYVPKMILSHQSSWFCQLFAEKYDKNIFTLTNVDAALFSNFLNLVYDLELDLIEEDIGKLLELLEKYGSEKCMKRLDQQLVHMEVKDDMKMLKLVDRYSLLYVKMKYNKKCQSADELKKIFRDPDVIKLSDELRSDLVSNKLPSLEESDDEPYYLYSKETQRISSNTRERQQNPLIENDETWMQLENPDVQNLGNSFLSLLAENNIDHPSEPASIQFSEFSVPSDMVIFNFKDNKIFYSSKQILANASHYFMKRYYGPDAKNDDNTIIFDKITSKDFNVLLNHVYHPTKSITGMPIS